MDTGISSQKFSKLRFVLQPTAIDGSVAKKYAKPLVVVQLNCTTTNPLQELTTRP